MIKQSSPWFDSVPEEKRFESLSGDLQTDFAVVGGGIAGVLTAWRLCEKGFSVALFEKDLIATGDTGFTTGFLTRVPDAMAASLKNAYGGEFLCKLFSATASAQADVLKLIKQKQISLSAAEEASEVFMKFLADFN